MNDEALGTKGWSGQAAQHDADHGEADEGGNGCGVKFEVARQSAIAANPSKGSFDQRPYNVAKSHSRWSVMVRMGRLEEEPER